MEVARKAWESVENSKATVRNKARFLFAVNSLAFVLLFKAPSGLVPGHWWAEAITFGVFLLMFVCLTLLLYLFGVSNWSRLWDEDNFRKGASRREILEHYLHVSSINRGYVAFKVDIYRAVSRLLFFSLVAFLAVGGLAILG
jgi:hypothetical protein